MKTIQVAYHRWHVVTGPAGGTVKSVDGSVTYCTIPEGGQGSFYAVTTEVVISDESIGVDALPVNFNCAPAKLKLLGLLGGGAQTLPAGYIPCDFLESTGTQYIIHDWQAFYNTPDIFDRGYAVTAQHMVESRYRFPLGVGWSNGTCNLTGPMYDASTYNRANFLTQAVYFSGISMLSKITTKMNYKNSRVVEFSAEDYYQKKDLTEQTLHGLLYGETNGGFGLFVSAWQGNSLNPNEALACRIWNVKFTEGDKVVHVVSPAVDVDGKPCMYDKILKKAFYNKGSGSFIAGFTLPQARKLSALPATGGTLTVSLPWEAQLIASGIPAILQAAADKGWTITVQYREPEADNEYYNRYAECVTVDDMLAVNPDYQNDLTIDGAWIYPLPQQTDFNDGLNWWRSKANIKSAVLETNVTYLGDIFYNSGLEHIKINAPFCKKMDTTFCSRRLLTADCYLPELEDGNYGFYDFRGTEFNADFPHMSKARFMLYNSINLNRALIKMPNLSDGTNLLYGSKLDRESVVCILGNIPAHASGTHNLTLGIHVDLQTNEEVIAAIADAEAKGWTLTVQWNGTATAQTASTFGLRKPPIYAKLGDMVLPDGTTEQYLDWGHYVTNWEENGYQEFASVEEAKEHFNIGD